MMGKLGVISVLAIAASVLIGVTMEPKQSEKSVSIYNAATGAVEQVSRIERSDEEWQRLLTPDQYRITRQRGTEAPSSGTCATSSPPPARWASASSPPSAAATRRQSVKRR